MLNLTVTWSRGYLYRLKNKKNNYYKINIPEREIDIARAW